MPSRTPVDVEAVIATYDRLGSAARTADELGIAAVTVYQILRVARGQCRLCANNVVLGRSYCRPCLTKLAERQRAKRTERNRAGLCEQCEKPIEPPSRTMCLEHREKHRQASEKHQPRHRCDDGRREKYLRMRYGPAAVECWREQQGRCEICQRHHQDRSTVIHHLDLDRTHANNTRENLALLCRDCHEAVHLLAEVTSMDSMQRWMAARYPSR